MRGYLERVVNRRELSAVDELVAADYAGGGHGWPSTLAELRAFYAWQRSARPDWRIDVQRVIELDECVVVHAHAGGTVRDDEQGRPLAAPRSRQVEWLAAYWLREGLITRIEVLALTERG